MNIEEARKVLWLKSDPRPLGELLDEGYLTKERLEWAAKWAYNSNLKLAAKIILDSMNHASPKIEEPKGNGHNKDVEAIEIGIPLDKARATPWPFPPNKNQPMGKLIDSKQLTLKDLGYAVEHAWDKKVRDAAVALSLVRLNQIVKEPVPSAGFVHIISGGRSYAERRESWFTLLQGMVTGWTLLLFVWLLVLLLSGKLNPKPSSVSITQIIASPTQLIAVIIVLILFIGAAWLVTSIPDRISRRLDKLIEEHRLGQEGEDNVVQLIVQALDGNWHLFRNVVLPGRNKADLDLVLVGPPGIWALEVKNFRGEYRNTGETWERKNGKKWKSAKVNPSRQANNSALRLKNFLKADNVNTFVNSAIIWANLESSLAVENPTVTVWKSARLADELGNIWQGEKISEVERNKIIDKLTKLCDQQKKAV